MKIISLVFFMLVIGLVFFSFAQFGDDLNANYNGTGINDSAWRDQFDNSEDINQSVAPLAQRFAELQDEDRGFFSKLASGTVAIPYAVILLPSLALDGLGMLGNIIVSTGTYFKAAPYIISVFLVMGLVWLVGRLLEFFQGNKA